MRFSDAVGRQVVSTSTATTVGKVDEFVVDPRRHAVIAVLLKKTEGGDTLLWSDILAFGADAVTVTSAGKIVDASPAITALSGKGHHLLGKRVLTSAGDELGRVDDVEFDPETGTINSLALVSGDVAGTRLIGVGSYAAVVRAE
ncbi:MAG TPA: PRC-barrel domain-containing protein [Acidothermaceae bacterium]|jgi:sporulation protein YlmC with PRC-barrel domain|nr:PRC-barrel domain-containing protein [Acidothermaceae bacterium]